MSDDLDIRHGSVVTVDTQSVRDAADRFGLLARTIEAITLRLRLAESSIAGASAGTGSSTAAVASAVATGCAQARRRALEAAEQSRDIERRLGRAAALYEAAELQVQLGIPGADRTALLGRLDDALARAGLPFGDSRQLGLNELDSLAAARETRNRSIMMREQQEWGMGIDSGFGPGIGLGGAGGLAGAAVALAFGGMGPALGMGQAGAPGTRAKGDPVHLTGGVTETASAPADLASAIDRVPGGEGDPNRIRLEKYTFPDGHIEWAIYVAGTQNGGDATEVFDMLSNLQLYTGHPSASLQAVRDAMAAAGVQPGDALHFVGYSQGSMITADLAAERADQTATHIGLGMPQNPVLGEGTLSVELSHNDDPVSALSGADAAAGTGSDESLLISRTATPGSAEGIGFDAHAATAYAQTARDAESSGDPRMAAPQAVFDHLAGASEVTAVSYGAVRAQIGTPGSAPTPAPAGGTSGPGGGGSGVSSGGRASAAR